MINQRGVFKIDQNLGNYVESKDGNIKISDDNIKKCLNDDIVEFNPIKKIITNIIKRCDKQIVGVLQITSKVTLGFTKRKIPQKKFIPADKKYPPFKVSTKIKSKGRDLYCIVKIKDWENGSKYPEAYLERIIGPIGEYNSEKEYLKYRNGVRWKKIKNNNINQIKLIKIDQNRSDYRLYHVFSIDPEGCKDIDDAFHFIEFDNKFEVGVHIADVSAFLPENSELDNIVKERGQSIYFPNEQINMLPDYLATNECSLIENNNRFVFSTILTFNKFSYELTDYKFKQGVINNKKNFSYNEVENLIKGDFKEEKDSVYGLKFWKIMLKSIYDLGKELYEGEDYDTHKLVEYFMILTNQLVAEYLTEKIPDKAIYRIFNGNKLRINNNNNEFKDAVMMSNLLKYEKANYIVGNENNTGHKDIGLEYYTHFTSPIRRYADILVHRLLKKVLYGNENDYINDYSLLCDKLNIYSKNIKKAEREMVRLNIIYKLYDFNNSVIETDGYIISINNNHVSIYIPELKIESICKVFSKKVEHIIDCISTENKLLIKSEKGKFELNLLEKVKIKVIISLLAPKFRDKILIQLIEPNPNLFIL